MDKWTKSLLPYLPPDIVSNLQKAMTEKEGRQGLVEIAADVGRRVKVMSPL